MRGREADWLDPAAEADWSARVGACATTRAGGSSVGAGASLDLGGDGSEADRAGAATRARDRASLAARLGVHRIVWLRQVHGTAVHVVPSRDVASIRPDDGAPPEADAVVCRRPRIALAVRAADCLPVLLADRAGMVIGAAHAGWRGLAAGVLEATVAAMTAMTVTETETETETESGTARAVTPRGITAWLGPAIGPEAFEIGPEVRDALAAHPTAPSSAFRRGRDDRWHADLWRLARARLVDGAGVGRVVGGGVDVHGAPERFFSHRRDQGLTGRQAALIWLR